jgi:hypothetical protein
MYGQSGSTFAEGAILLVAGRVDHRGEEASLLADAVWVWEDAAARGPAAIAKEVADGDRGRGGNRRWSSGSGGGNGNGNGYSRAPAAQAPRAPMPTPDPSSSSAPMPMPTPAPKVRVSPLRGGGVTVTAPAASVPGSAGPASPPALPASAFGPSEPLSALPEPCDFAAFAPDREEPPLPDEARAVAARASAAPTAPLEAPEAGVLQVRFTRGAETSRIVWAMEELRAMLKERPGATRVVFNLPGPGGGTLPMEVRGGVAYDAELLAEVQRRVGEGLVRLEISIRHGA